MLALAPSDRRLKLDLAWATARVALVNTDPAGWQQTATLLAEADAIEPLGDLDDELLTVARIAGAL